MSISKNLIRAVVNRAIANGAPVIVEHPAGCGAARWQVRNIDEPGLRWDNAEGWCPQGEWFTDDERVTLAPPMGGEWVTPFEELERPSGCGAAVNPIKRNHAADNAAAWYEDIKGSLERYHNSADEDVREAAYQEIHEGPLSVLVRDGWRSPFAPAEDGAEEYEILLSTGGPALRLYGRLNEHGEPNSAALQYQDWGTPWTDWYLADGEGVFDEVARTLLAYASCFSFGE